MMESVSLSEAQIESSRGFRTDDERLRPITDKVFTKQHLDFKDDLTLYDSSDILAMN